MVGETSTIPPSQIMKAKDGNDEVKTLRTTENRELSTEDTQVIQRLDKIILMMERILKLFESAAD